MAKRKKRKYSIVDLYQFAKSKNGKCLSKKYKIMKTKYLWECKQGHRWNTSWDNIKQGKWCKICARKELLNDPIRRKNYTYKIRNSLANPENKAKRIKSLKEYYARPDVKEKASKLRKGKRNSIKTEFKKGFVPWNKGKKGVMPEPWNKGKKGLQDAWNKGVIGKFNHTEGAKFKIKQARANQVFPVKDSKPEVIIQKVLNELNIEFITHKYMREIKHSYQCDIFIPKFNLIIEIDGDYWHGNENNLKYKVLNERQLKSRKRDKIRTKELQEVGFHVLRLWESEINENLSNCIKKIKSFL
jgi:very-short-patch-repair endonuclease